jgi:hypothetical protein
MTLDNEDGTTPNYGGEREPNLKTGKDAANFFARNRGAASIKFVHLNPEQTGDDYRPYDLVVVRPEDVRNAMQRCWLSVWFLDPLTTAAGSVACHRRTKPGRVTWCALRWVWCGRHRAGRVSSLRSVTG